MKRGTPAHLSIFSSSGTFPGHDAVKAQLTEAHDGPYDSIHFHLRMELNGFYVSSIPYRNMFFLFIFTSNAFNMAITNDLYHIQAP